MKATFPVKFRPYKRKSDFNINPIYISKIIVMKSCCQIYSMRTKSLNSFQRKNTRMFKVNSFSTTVYTRELISFPILVLHPVSHSHQLRSGHLGICRIAWVRTSGLLSPLMFPRELRERIIETTTRCGFSAT